MAIDIIANRKLKFAQKYNVNLPRIQNLRDYQLCLEKKSNGKLAVSGEGFRHLMGAVAPEETHKVSAYLEHIEAIGKNLFSPLIMSLYLLRPDISPLAFQHAPDLLESFREDGVKIEPFLSLNDFSAVSDILHYALPGILNKDAIQNLAYKIRSACGPKIGWSSPAPFFLTQTDKAAQTIFDYLANKFYTQQGLRPGNQAKEIDKVLHRLKVRWGQGIEFEFAPKDLSFFRLGDIAGDCSAYDKENQMDRTENVFYDIPLWTAMPGYQVLSGYYNNHFVIKFHLMVISILNQWTLLVDATETNPLVRDWKALIEKNKLPSDLLRDNLRMSLLFDNPYEKILTFKQNARTIIREELAGSGLIDEAFALYFDACDSADKKADLNLIAQRDAVFDAGIDLIRSIGRQMGNLPILAEFFSNTPWVREKYLKFPEKVINIPSQLEDGMIRDSLENLIHSQVIKHPSFSENKIPLHIQVQRKDISDQGLRPGNRLLYILDNVEPDKSIPYRGV